MIKLCTCRNGGSSSSPRKQSRKKKKIRKSKSCCKSCGGKEVVTATAVAVDAREGKLSGKMMSNMGLELPRVIDPHVNWNTATKGRQRAVRRARTSFTGDNIKKPENKPSNSCENATDEEFEKVGVTILGQRFSDSVQSIPIKKRRFPLRSPSPPPGFSHLADLSQLVSSEVTPANSDSSQVDFSGISILAEVACESDLTRETGDDAEGPASGVQGENGPFDQSSASSALAVNSMDFAEEEAGVSNGPGCSKPPSCPQDASEKPCPPARDFRLHWDLNTVMDSWEMGCHEDISANHVVKCADVADQNGAGVAGQNGADESSLAEPELSFDQQKCSSPGLAVGQQPFAPTTAEQELKSETEPPPTPVQEINMLSVSHLATSEELTMEEYSTVQACEMTPKEESKCTTQSETCVLLNDISQTDRGGHDGEQKISVEEEEECTTEQKNPSSFDENPDAAYGNGTAPPEPADGKSYCIDTTAFTFTESIQGPINDHDDVNVNEHPPPLPDNVTETRDVMTDYCVDCTPPVSPVSEGRGGGDLPADSNFVKDQMNDCSDHPSDVRTERIDLEVEYQYEDGELREQDGFFFELAEMERAVYLSDERENKPFEQALLDVPANVPLPADTLPQEEEQGLLLVSRSGGDIGQDDAAGSGKKRSTADMAERSNSKGREETRRSRDLRIRSSGWDRLPEESTRVSGRDLVSEKNSTALPAKDGFSSFRGEREYRSRVERPRPFDDVHHYWNHKFFVKSSRTHERLDLGIRAERRVGAPSTMGRGGGLGSSRHLEPGNRAEEWPETRNRDHPVPTRHRSPEYYVPSAASFPPSGSRNAAAQTVAKMESNGFVVSPDGTLVKVVGSGSHRYSNARSFYNRGSPTNRDRLPNSFVMSRDRDVSPPGRSFRGSGRGGRSGRFGRPEPTRERDLDLPLSGPHLMSRREQSFSPHRRASSPSRSGTRSPNMWASPRRDRPNIVMNHRTERERERSPRRVGPTYGDRTDGNYGPRPQRNNHSSDNISPHGPRWVGDRRCTSPFSYKRSERFDQLDSPPRRPREGGYLHQPVVHHGRFNGYDRRRDYDDHYEVARPPIRNFDRERNFNGDGFRARNSGLRLSEFQRRGGSPGSFDRHGLDRGGKEERNDFKYGPGGKRKNGNYKQYELQECRDDDDDDTDADVRRLS